MADTEVLCYFVFPCIFSLYIFLCVFDILTCVYLSSVSAWVLIKKLPGPSAGVSGSLDS